MCPVNLLGRDLLCKLRAQLSFEPGRIDLTIPVQQMYLLHETINKPITEAIPKEVVDHVNAEVWDTEHPKRVVPTDTH